MNATLEIPQSHTRGFTLLELMVGLTLAGMLLLAGLPSFTTFLRNTEVRSTSEAISNGLRVARSEATRLNRPVSFTLAGGDDPSWSINILNPITGVVLQPPIQQYSKFEVGRSARVDKVPANAVAVTFNGLGRIVSRHPSRRRTCSRSMLARSPSAKPARCASSSTTCAESGCAIPIPRSG